MEKCDITKILIDMKNNIELIKSPYVNENERDNLIGYFNNYFKNLPLDARNNKDIAEFAISYKEDNYKYIGDKLKNDKDFALFVYSKTCDINTINKDLIDEEFIINTVKNESFRYDLINVLYKNNSNAFGEDYFNKMR